MSIKDVRKKAKTLGIGPLSGKGITKEFLIGQIEKEEIKRRRLSYVAEETKNLHAKGEKRRSEDTDRKLSTEKLTSDHTGHKESREKRKSSHKESREKRKSSHKESREKRKSSHRELAKKEKTRHKELAKKEKLRHKRGSPKHKGSKGKSSRHKSSHSQLSTSKHDFSKGRQYNDGTPSPSIYKEIVKEESPRGDGQYTPYEGSQTDVSEESKGGVSSEEESKEAVSSGEESTERVTSEEESKGIVEEKIIEDTPYFTFTSLYKFSKDIAFLPKSNYGTEKKKLGSGTFGAVYRYDKGNKSFAVKMLNEGNHHRASTIAEISVLFYLSHPNIIGAIDVIENIKPSDPAQVGLVLPLALSDLFDKTATFSLSSDQKRSIAYQITCGVAYMHSLDIMHRDIKTQNVLLFNNGAGGFIAQLSDFGSAKAYGCFLSTGFTEVEYTLWYRPIEVLIDAKYYRPADIWALGCVIYEIYNSYTLFREPNELAMVKAITRFLGNPDGETIPASHSKDQNMIRIIDSAYQLDLHLPEYPVISSDPWSRDLHNLLDSIFHYDPNLRPAAYQLAHHKLFEGLYDSAAEYPPRSCLATLRDKESYPKNGIARQAKINENMVNILIDWLITIWKAFNLKVRTFMTTINLLDQVIVLTLVTQENLQLLGCVCLQIASLVCEKYPHPPSTNDLVYFSAASFNAKEFETKKREILKLTSYDLIISTVSDFGEVKYAAMLAYHQYQAYKSILFFLMMNDIRFTYLPEELSDFAYHLTNYYFDKSYAFPPAYTADRNQLFDKVKKNKLREGLGKVTRKFLLIDYAKFIENLGVK